MLNTVVARIRLPQATIGAALIYLLLMSVTGCSDGDERHGGDNEAQEASAPLELQALGGFHSVELSWQKLNGAQHYTIYRCPDEVFCGIEAVIGETEDDQWIDWGLEAGEAPHYWVLARLETGQDVAEGPVSASAIGLPATTSLHCTSDAGELQLSWESLPDAPEGISYRIFGSPFGDGSVSSFVRDVGGADTRGVNLPRDEFDHVFYALAAILSSGETIMEGALSEWASCLPALPSERRFIVASNQATLIWQADSYPAVTSYEVRWHDTTRPQDMSTLSVHCAAEQECEATISDLENDSAYSAWTVAINAAGSSPDPDPRPFFFLSADRSPPCLAIEGITDTLNFGFRRAGQSSSRLLTLRNCSDTVDVRLAELQIVNFGDEVFTADLEDAPRIIPPGGQWDFEVTFSALEVGTYEGQLLLRSNAVNHLDRAFLLTGTAVAPGDDSVCPTAKIRANILGSDDFETVELNATLSDTVVFDASESEDISESELTYEWAIVGRPADSNNRLTSSADEQTRLSLSMPGTYEVELNVINALGIISCEPARFTVHVTPGDMADIQIVLTWSAEGVGEPRDGRGTDLDLHYLHPLGRWDQSPYDVMWRNKRQNWGTQANPR